MAPEPWYTLRDPDAVATPALLVWRERLVSNIRHAITLAGSPARLRPHVKTHKCARVVELMRTFGIERFKAATVAEAHMAAGAGAPDVLLAYPLIGENARRFGRLRLAYPRTRFATIVDSAAGLHSLSAGVQAAGDSPPLPVYVDVDVGMHRTGIAAQDAVELARLVGATAGLVFAGLHLYDGHNHESSVEVRQSIARAAWGAGLAIRERLGAAGIAPGGVVVAGTPSFPFYAMYPLAELSPGTCFFHDAGYGRAFPDLGFEPAALVLSRVVSRPSTGTVTLDCGHKAVAADPPQERAVAMNLEGARTVLQSEEHWVLSSPEASRLAIGDVVYLLPTHICPTFALHREALVVGAEGRIEERWPVTARDRSLGI